MKIKKLIIIADDEPSILRLLELTLEDDYQLILVEDGKGVMDAIKKKKPDLIILDVMMPNMNGYEVCEQIKSDKRTRDIKIAMLSAKGQEKDIVLGLEIGADHYITKPFNPRELQKLVAEILR